VKPVQPTLDEAIAAAWAATASANREALDATGWDAAVAAWDAVVLRLPRGAEGAAQAMTLDVAARTRLRRAWAGGPEDDVAVAVQLWRRATEVMPPTFAHRPAMWSNLGVALRDLSASVDSAALLDEAVAAGQAAVDASDASTSVGVEARLQLGKSLRMCFKERQHSDALDRAVTVLLDAALAADDPNATSTSADCQESLGNALYDRYQLNGARADQEAAVTHLRSALRLIPANDPDAPAYSSNLASALVDRFELDGKRVDLTEAIGLLDGAVAAVGDECASSDLLTNLGNALRLRAVADGSGGHIERAVDLLARAVEREADGSRRAGMLNNFASGLLERYDLTGRIADVDDAIAAVEESLSITPPGDADRAARLNNLGIALRTRLLHRGRDRADLDRAVAAFEEAIAVTSAQAPEVAALHANLGNVLHQRHDVAGDPRDLDRAVREHEAALARTPDDSADRPGYLNNLAAALAARAAGDLGADDLDRAVHTAAEAVRLCPPGSARRATHLVNLGNALSERHERSSDADDLAAGREAYRSAASTGLAASPAEAFAAAHNWSEWACDRRAWAEVAEAYGYGEQATRALFRAQLARADKESWLRDAQGLATDGAYAFVARSALRDAVLALERGRALLLSEALEREWADLTRLEAAHAALAARFRAGAARVRLLELPRLV
jgi:hypothetical protein